MTNKRHPFPHPLDTSAITLPADLLALAETLAENIHENWAQLRIIQGWTLGEARDDARKEHPCLVPYAELTEEERDYDRRTSQETLKTVLALGWTIERKA